MNPASKRLRDRLREATRAAILDAAQAEFSAHGFSSGRMEEIARRAGVSVGTLYNYYEDRGALLEALLERHRELLLSRVDDALAKTARDGFEGRLRAFVGTVVEHFRENRALVAVAIEEELAGGRRNPKKVHTLRELSVRAEALIAQGVKENALRRDDASMFPTYLVGILRSVAVRVLHSDERIESDAATAAILRFFFQGAGKRP
ncbi:MAG: TetR/AcrR family transcriptional regulator [Myxococcaceae bacterium]|nr:TetR/AcrR family transcriptional regulator [Myxococcaceae bacterium]